MRIVLLLAFAVSAFAQVSFFAKGTFSLPYANVTQPFEVNVSPNERKAVWSFFNGLEKTTVLGNQVYLDHVRLDHRECVVSASSFESAVPSFIPDISANGWTYAGDTFFRDIPVQKYVRSHDHSEDLGGDGPLTLALAKGGDVKPDAQVKTSHYEFYRTAGGVPVRFLSLGVNAWTGSHYDHYEVIFDVYRENYVVPDAFELADYCQKAEAAPNGSAVPGTVRLMKRLFSGAAAPVTEADTDAEFQAWAMSFGKTYASQNEVAERRAVWVANKHMIDTHNSDTNRTYSMAMNQFGDLTDAEIESMFMGRTQSQAAMRASAGADGDDIDWSAPDDDMIRTIDTAEPAVVDWRISGVAGRVKDQCSCGSCWTFGTIGTIEGRYNLRSLRQAAGQPVEFVEFSEQNIVNCFWTDNGVHSEGPNLGCNGGTTEDSFHALMKDDWALAIETDEPYMGVDSWCRKDLWTTKSEHKPTSWARVPRFDATQMKRAVAEGPVSIAIAVPKSLAFYSHGVYNDVKCDPYKLGHQVTLNGYAVDPLTGKEYWIVKNSWSSHWGASGYIYIEVDEAKNYCGVLTEASYAIYE